MAHANAAHASSRRPTCPSMPDVSTTLTDYLRNFALWCRHGFADKISGTTAQPASCCRPRRAGRDDPEGVHDPGQHRRDDRRHADRARGRQAMNAPSSKPPSIA